MASNLTSRIDENMAGGGGVELPFMTGVAWVLNGDAKMAPLVQAKQSPAASFFGGWAAGTDDFAAMFESINAEVLPTWKQATLSNRAGKAYEVYVARTVTFAPFAIRSSWLHKDTKVRYPDYVQGATQHIQIAGYFFYQVKNQNGGQDEFKPLFPIVLTAKGFQAKNVQEALKAWKRNSMAARKKLGERGESPWAFCMTIGTFGQERKSKMVGPQGGKQSPITPVELAPVEKLTAEYLEPRFVGDAVLETMNEMAGMAAEWMNAWKMQVDESALAQAVERESNGETERNPEEVGERFYDDES